MRRLRRLICRRGQADTRRRWRKFDTRMACISTIHGMGNHSLRRRRRLHGHTWNTRQWACSKLEGWRLVSGDRRVDLSLRRRADRGLWRWHAAMCRIQGSIGQADCFCLRVRWPSPGITCEGRSCGDRADGLGLRVWWSRTEHANRPRTLGIMNTVFFLLIPSGSAQPC